MNEIEKMIESLCPDGVEFRELRDICTPLRKATLKVSELLEDGEYPVINSGRNLYGYYNKYNNEGNALIVAARGEYAGFINYIDTKFWAGGLCYPYRS
ncbi:restriction endonuclease subunit S, partial [Rodentibacter caecimuris]